MKRIRPHWRKMTWVIIAWSVLCTFWLFSGMSSASDIATSCATDPDVTSGILTKQECIDASQAGAGLGAVFIIFIWGFILIVLSLIWFMTRPREKHVVYVERAQ